MAQLQQYYEWDSSIGRAWNTVQVKVCLCNTASQLCSRP